MKKRSLERQDPVATELVTRYGISDMPDGRWAKEHVLPAGWTEAFKNPTWLKEQQESSKRIQTEI